MRPRLSPLPSPETHFGWLTTTGEIRRIPGRSLVVCVCKCGTVKALRPDDLRRGKITSCGCRIGIMTANRNRKSALHGQSNTPEHQIWRGIIARTTYPGDKYWPRYGGRGIILCERWRDFRNFYADMGPRPSPAHSIDRIDNDGSYSPENCRWATCKEQNNNRRNNRKITIDGVSLTLTQWCE